VSYSLDANILLYASDESSPRSRRAAEFLKECLEEADLLCLAWPTLMAYQRIATHPGIFQNPLSPREAWKNIRQLMSLARVRIIGEQPGFAEEYEKVTGAFPVRGNHVPDAHLAAILRQHGVKTLYSADADFRKFDFLKVVNPFA
jgi:hypothetical protein